LAKKVKTLNALVSDYEFMNEKLKNFEKLYIGNIEIINFTKTLKTRFQSELEKKLETIKNLYYEKDPNLNYYQEDIDNSIKSLVDSFGVDIEGYFDELFGKFYNEFNLEYVQESMTKFELLYITD
jgi:hypothetical protein